MPFYTKEFPGQRFGTIEEYKEAQQRRREVEKSLADRVQVGEENVVQVSATIVPASRGLLEGKVVELEARMLDLSRKVEGLASGHRKPGMNKEGIKIGTVFQGESRGRRYTLEALEDAYLCSDGRIYASLSGAALGVSGNRRSGWRFWRSATGLPVGEITGRFGGFKRGYSG